MGSHPDWVQSESPDLPSVGCDSSINSGFKALSLLLGSMPCVHHPVNSLGLEWWPILQFGYQNLGTLLKASFTHVQLRRSPGVHIGLEVQFSSVAQSCLTLCNPIYCSKPGFPVHHQFPRLTQTHIHQVSDAIQPSHPLSSPSSLAFNLSQHRGLFQ